MRRFVSLVLVFTLLVGVVGIASPSVAVADPTVVVLAYTQYVQGLAAAGLSYGGVTYANLKTRGMSDRDIAGVVAGLARYGVMGKPVAGSDVSYGQVLATYIGMQARNTWTAFSTACNSAYQFGSYAWAQLQSSFSSVFAYQGASTAGTGYTTLYSGSLTATQRTWITPMAVARTYGMSGGNNTAFAAMIVGLFAGGASLPFRIGSNGVYTDTAFRSPTIYAADGVTVLLAGAAVAANWFTFRDSGLNYDGAYVGNGLSIAALEAYLAGNAAPATPAPLTYPKPYLVPNPDPFPGETPDPDPTKPDMFPIPLPWVHNPPTVGTTSSIDSSGVPFILPGDPANPPPGTIHTPLGPGTRLGDGAKAAAAAMTAQAPELFGWLVAPFSWLLNTVGDILNFLQDCWNQVCAWIAGLVYPGAAGMAAHFTVPFQNLQTAFSTHWPFAAVPLIGSIGLILVQHSTGQTQTLPDSWTINFWGAVVTIHLADWTAPLVPYRWVFLSALYLWVLVSMWRLFKPKVSM